jgi:hypothetical protein
MNYCLKNNSHIVYLTCYIYLQLGAKSGPREKFIFYFETRIEHEKVFKN